MSPLTFILFLYHQNQTAVILLVLQDSGRQGGGRRAQEQCRPHRKVAQRGPILEYQIDGRTSGGQVAVSTALGSEKLLHPWQCRAVHSDPAGGGRYGIAAGCCPERECTGCGIIEGINRNKKNGGL